MLPFIASRHLRRSATALITLASLLGCSLRDLDYLNQGHHEITGGNTSSAGGSVEEAGGIGGGGGGTVATAGSAGTNTSGGGNGAIDIEPDPILPVLSCGGTACGDPTLIADMENNDGKPCATDGRGGYSIVFNDGTGKQWPQPNGQTLTAFSPLAACRGHSAVALHTKGAGFTSWGAGTAIHFGDGGWDASAYRGIIFWAMSPTATKLNVGIVTSETQDVAYGGTCVPKGGKQCADHFAASRTLTPGWIAYTISFDELRQGGWGVAAESGTFDATHVMDLNITFTPLIEPFDVWFDDFGFTQ